MKTDFFREPPIPKCQLVNDLKVMGVGKDQTLMVHSSLSAIGWVLGGAATVVDALIEVIGEDSTLVMPAATPFCGDPTAWPGVEIPEDHLPAVRDHLPVFDPRTTPTTMGAIPETFRNWPGTFRSHHPLESICAHGPAALEITRFHPLAYSEGPDGPFGRLDDLDAQILLLGVGFNRCTALHFAETLATSRREQSARFPSLVDGIRTWHEVPNVADDNDTHFPVIGEQFVAAHYTRAGTIGRARTTLFSMRELTEFAIRYFENNL